MGIAAEKGNLEKRNLEKDNIDIRFADCKRMLVIISIVDECKN